MAHVREELAFGAVGGLGGFFCRHEFALAAFQFRGALFDSELDTLVGGLEEGLVFRMVADGVDAGGGDRQAA